MRACGHGATFCSVFDIREIRRYPNDLCEIGDLIVGQAKNRGTQAQRVADAQAKIAASKPEKLICNGCQADVLNIHPVSTQGLSGVEAIWVGQCDCGQTTFAASGEPKAVQAFFDALSEDSELTLGSQSKDGAQHATIEAH